MPIYEYRCKNCGDFETMQRITERPLTRCPRCKGKVTKLMSNTSFQLKGSGWYVTDYAGKGSSAKEKSEGKSEGTGEASSSSSASDGKGASTDTKGSTEKVGSKDTKASTKHVAAA